MWITHGRVQWVDCPSVLSVYNMVSSQPLLTSFVSNFQYKPSSRGTKVKKMLTLAPERYTAGFYMVAKVILWCI